MPTPTPTGSAWSATRSSGPAANSVRGALALCLIGSFLAGAESVGDKLISLPPGQRLEIRQTNGQILRGKLGEVRPYDFVLQPAKTGEQPQTIPYATVETVNTKRSGSDKLILLGAGVALYCGLLFAFGNR